MACPYMVDFRMGFMILVIVGTFHETSLHGVFGWDDVYIVLTGDLYGNDCIVFPEINPPNPLGSGKCSPL